MKKVRCIRGHVLPHTGSEGECTPVRCGAPEEKSREPKVTALARADKGDRGELLKGVRDARMKLVDAPEGLEGAAAETHVTKKLMDLTPYAVAELEYQLMYGTDKQRADMAMDILDRAGFGKKGESGGVGGPVIVVNLGTGKLPWAPKGEVVDGEVEK